jgi:alginate O-acetyltransferase complex protein AlgI
MWQIDIHKILDHFAYNPADPLIFSSGFFLFLFTGFVAVYAALAHTDRPKLIFVTLFSLYFYYKSSGIYFLLLILATVVDFTLARMIFETPVKSHKRFFLIASLAINLGVLAYFKYTNFLFDSFFSLTGARL